MPSLFLQKSKSVISYSFLQIFGAFSPETRQLESDERRDFKVKGFIWPVQRTNERKPVYIPKVGDQGWPRERIFIHLNRYLLSAFCMLGFACAVRNSKENTSMVLWLEATFIVTGETGEKAPVVQVRKDAAEELGVTLKQ